MGYLSTGSISTAKSKWCLLKRSAQSPPQLNITQWLYSHFKACFKHILAGSVTLRVFFQHRKLLSAILKATYQLDSCQKFDYVVSSGDVAISMLAVFWHHPHGLQQQLIGSPTEDQNLTRRKTSGGWWLTPDEMCLSSTYFISQGYNENLAQMQSFTWWSYTVRRNQSHMTVCAHRCNHDTLRCMCELLHPKHTKQTHICHGAPKPVLFPSLITCPIYILWAAPVFTLNNFCQSRGIPVFLSGPLLPVSWQSLQLYSQMSCFAWP